MRKSPGTKGMTVKQPKKPRDQRNDSLLKQPKKPRDQRSDSLLKQHTLIWKQLKEFLRSLNEGVAEGEMSISQREGIRYND